MRAAIDGTARRVEVGWKLADGHARELHAVLHVHRADVAVQHVAKLLRVAERASELRGEGGE